jgi:hypothetical protein
MTQAATQEPAKEPAAPPPAPEPPSPPPPPANPWAAAVAQIRATCNWLIATMGAVAAAAVGSGALLSFKNADSWLRLGWVIWGLSLTVVGALIVLWRATLVKLPVSGSIAALVNPVTAQFLTIAPRIDQDRVKQFIPTVLADLQKQKEFDDKYEIRRREVIALAGSDKPEDKKKLALAEAWVGYFEDRLTELQAGIRASLHRAMYMSHRKRFREAMPWIFVGALMVAIGFPTYFAAARLETKVADDGKKTTAASAPAETATASTDLAAPVPASITFTADRFKNLVATCTDQPRVQTLVLGGNGATDTPWRIRVLPTRSCPSAFDLAVTRDDAQVQLAVVDPVLTSLVAAKTPAAAEDVKPKLNAWDAYFDATGMQQFSLVLWLLSGFGLIVLVFAVARERDEEL